MDQLDNFLAERSDKAPLDYVEMVYRREFGYTPQEMGEIPTRIIERDLLFLSREGQARKLMQK